MAGKEAGTGREGTQGSKAWTVGKLITVANHLARTWEVSVHNLC